MTAPDETRKSYVVSEFIPSTKQMRAHWSDLLATTDEAKARALCATLKGRGRIETFTKKLKKK